MSTLKTASDTVLVVSNSLICTAALSGMLEQASLPIDVLHSATCREASEYLSHTRISVVISETLLPDGNWRDLLSFIESAELPPALVVTSTVAGESLWAEVLNLGGFDVLAQPLEDDEVARVVQSAMRASSKQLHGHLA